MSKIVIGIVFLLLTNTSSQAWAKKSPEFQSMAIQKIKGACVGQDIHLKKGYEITNSVSGETQTAIKWPYTSETIAGLVRGISEAEPFPRYVLNQSRSGMLVMGGSEPPALELLKCGEHVLDVNYDDWYLDGIKLEPPKQIQNFEILQQGPGSIYQRTEGNNSPALVGNHNKIQISRSAFSFLKDARFGLSVSVALTVSLVFNFLRNGRRKKPPKS